MADQLISPVFIERFKKELIILGASSIDVELKKTRSEYGKVYHRIQLKKCTEDVCTTDILSEGEFRIVSLAVFLADVIGQPNKASFIFDDPISSLDIDFEEATAKRLVSLSKDRQVIIFTHRLSLLSLLQDISKKEEIDPKVICLRRERWGIGEPGNTPINAKRPDKALASILNDRVPKAKKILETEGMEIYESIAKGICSDIRILIERVVENNLLSDVVQRFRRSVQTLNKIDKLAKINPDDCSLLDKLMTKYSFFEHSQPLETPVQLPDPDELSDDLNKMISWIDEFSKRAA